MASLLIVVRDRVRFSLVCLFLLGSLVTTCVVGPIGVYLALSAALASLIFTFDREMLRQALKDWGVRSMLIAFFLLWASFFIAAKSADDPMAFVDFLALPIVAPAFALLARQAHPKSVAIVSILAGLGCVAALATGLYDVHVRGMSRAEGNTSSIFFSDMAILLGFFALLGLWVINSRLKWFLVACQACALGAAILGGTRGAILAELCFLAVFSAFTLLAWKRPLLERALTVAVIFVIDAISAAYLFDLSRTFTIFSTARELISSGTSNDMSASYRLEFYQAGLSTFLESPLFGHGWWRRFSAAVPHMSIPGADYMAQGKQAHLHNDILNFASASGLVGVAAYLLLIAAPMISALRSPRGERWMVRMGAATGLGLGYFVMGLTDTMFVYEIPKSMFVLCSAITMAFFRDQQPAHTTPMSDRPPLSLRA